MELDPQENSAAGKARDHIEQAIQIVVDQDLESAMWGLVLYEHLAKALRALTEGEK